jgi:hypothetical protein
MRYRAALPLSTAVSLVTVAFSAHGSHGTIPVEL